ncbi:MAG TPA: glycosyltransferase family 4 protein, partial [bacterium]|nr:glycosyltransferase family 4 protein [bacterium]
TARRTKKILAVTDYVLTPLHEGGALRLYSLLRGLGELGHQATFLPRTDHFPHQNGSLEEATAYLRSQGIEVPGGPKPEPLREHLERAGGDYDAVILSGAYAAQYCFQSVRRLAPQATLIYDTVDLHHRRLFREAKLSGSLFHLRQALATKKSELLCARHADLTLTVTEEERKTLARECPGARTFLLSNVHEVHRRAGDARPGDDILFLGAFHHPPNLDAVFYFLDEIFPSIASRLPEIRLQVVGSNPPPELRARGSDRIRIRGFVTDLGEAMAGSRLSVAPLRFGAGVKGKILASMAYGLPVVATATAIEGMELKPGENILSADGPEEFALQVERLTQDEALWKRISAAGQDWVERNYSPAAARSRLCQMLEACELPKEAQS